MRRSAKKVDCEMPTIINKLINLKTIIAIIMIMTIIHVFAIYYDLYSGDVWIDMPLHFVGGFLAGVVGYWAMSFRFIGEKFGQLNLLATCFVLISISLFGSFIWEIFEFILLNCCESWARAGRLISPTVPDLLSDMVLGVTGGILFVVVLVFAAARKPKFDEQDHEVDWQ